MTKNEDNDINTNTNINQNYHTDILTLNNNDIKPEVNSSINNNHGPNPNNMPIQISQEQNINTNSNIIPVKDTQNKDIRVDNFAENNISARNIINNALFSQLSKINVKLLDLDDNLSQKLYKSEKNILPKIDMVDIKLLNQSTSIIEFKKYGFGLYVFFLYLIELLVTFAVLFIFAFYYMYCIFYKYYREYEEKYSLFFDYNILSLVSGVQLIKFRKYCIFFFGKNNFLENYKNFDVIYKEYLFTGTIIFIIVFLINFAFMLYFQKIYKLYRIENPEIKNYSLILSGKSVPYLNKDENDNDENANMNSKKESIKNKIIKELDIKDTDINFTFKLSKYYEKMEEFKILKNKKYILQYKVNRNKCCCHGCCCFCGRCFCCCCNKNNYVKKIHNINDKIDIIKNEMNDIKIEEITHKNYISFLRNLTKPSYSNSYFNENIT